MTPPQPPRLLGLRVDPRASSQALLSVDGFADVLCAGKGDGARTKLTASLTALVLITARLSFCFYDVNVVPKIRSHAIYIPTETCWGFS